jgi:hypothetical protein
MPSSTPLDTLDQYTPITSHMALTSSADEQLVLVHRARAELEQTKRLLAFRQKTNSVQSSQTVLAKTGGFWDDQENVDVKPMSRPVPGFREFLQFFFEYLEYVGVMAARALKAHSCGEVVIIGASQALGRGSIPLSCTFCSYVK